MKIYADRAVALQMEGYNCCQCVAGCICEVFGLNRMDAFRYAGMFGHGIAGTGETCGAVIGAMMALGFCYAKQLPEDKPGDQHEIYEVSAEFFRRFKEETKGRTKCKELMRKDPSIEKERQFIIDHDFHNKVCRNLIIRKAADIVTDLMHEYHYI